jgi:hypothetical protein
VKITFICCVFILMQTLVYSQKLIYANAANQDIRFYFEDRDTAGYFLIDPTQKTNVWVIGKPSKKIFNSALSPSLALITDSVNSYPPNCNSYFTIKVTSDDVSYISFNHKYDFNKNVDGGIIEASYDGGKTWSNIITTTCTNGKGYNLYSSADIVSSHSNQPGFTGQSNGWVKTTLCFNKLYNTLLRFICSSSGKQVSNEGWMIDNFEVGTGFTGIPEKNNQAQLYLLQNPVNDFIDFHVDPATTIVSYEIYDMVGKIVLSGTYPDKKINISTMKAGIYYCQFNTRSQAILRKVIKQ